MSHVKNLVRPSYYLILLAFSSCSTIDADGTWIAAYQVQDSLYWVQRKVVEFSGNKIRLKSLRLPIETMDPNDSIVLETSVFNPVTQLMGKFIRYEGDSLGYVEKSGASVTIYKRIPKDSKNKVIQYKDFLNQAFETKSAYHSDTIEFLNDTTYIEYQNPYNHRDYWMIQKYSDFNFLIVGQVFNVPLIPTENANGHLRFHAFFKNDGIVNFEKINEKMDTTGLCGNWIEVKTTYPDPDRPPPPRQRLLEIRHDSTYSGSNKNPKKWLLSPSHRFICFRNEYSSYTWRIRYVDREKLILEMKPIDELEIVEFKRVRR